ncbi:MAG: YraN family protein [Halocynthiibacter sp.]
MSGATSYHAGLAAEAIVLRHYQALGGHLRARRWRARHAEIDLIVKLGPTLVFVEVKKSRNFESAAMALGNAQMRRIHAAAAEFLAGEPAGQDSEARFDVALVNGQGALRIIENAFGH